MVAALAGCASAPDVSRTVLTSARQVRQLSAAQARLGAQVRIQGILTYFDAISSYCFVQDSTGGIRVTLAPGQIPPAPGWRVAVAGRAFSGGPAPTVVEGRVAALGAGKLPAPVSIAPPHLGDPEHEYQRVAVSGVVQSVVSERPGLPTLEIRVGTAMVRAQVPASVTATGDEWTDAEVRATGVLAESFGGNLGTSATLWIADAGAIEITHPATPSVAAAESGDLEPTAVPASTLTTALAVRQLPLAAPRHGYAVRLRAVVTYFDPVNHLLFVQDPTDGIFVQMNGKAKLSLRAGDQVEIIGVTVASFAPDLLADSIRVLGHPGLPAPKTARFGSANWGREDCHWLELAGIVQRVAQGTGDTVLTLAFGKAMYSAHVLAPPAALAHLVDAEVSLRGVCGAIFNAKRQMLGIQMYVPGSDCIRVVEAPDPDPFSMAATPVADLLQFSRARDMGHRVRMRGTVTYPNRSGPTWIRDATGGVMIQDHETAALAAGDLVDVVGFPEIAGFGPALRGAQMKRLQSGAPPAPVRITVAEAMKGDFDGQLVQIDGKLVDQMQLPAQQVLAVASGEIIFNADLPVRRAAQPLKPGTRLRLTGICSVQAEPSYDLIPPLTFRLLLRSPADMAIVGRPPWLTADRVVPILAGAALLAIAALAWAGLLRKRVRAQTFALRAQTVQLQAANQGTRDALRKACDAESLEVDSNRILELIARDEPVVLIVDRIAEAVALHCEGAACAILLGAPHGARVCVVPAMPGDWLDVLAGIDIRSVSFSPELRAPAQFSEDPAWADFIHSQRNARFRTFCSAPIVVDGATAGVIAAFFRNERRFADAQGAQLGLWCNIAALALERRRLHDQLSFRAQHDGLTGLPNRALLYERLEQEIARASCAGSLLGLIYLDLDGFKQINDSHGHDAGDAVLQEVGRRMTQAVRREDTVARIGGDEFVVLLPMLGRREDAHQVADKIAAAVREPIYSHHQRLSVSACVGIGIWPLDGEKPDPLLRFADAQMYGQKRRRWYDASAKPPEQPRSAPERSAGVFTETVKL